jgi:stress-induced morphogen
MPMPAEQIEQLVRTAFPDAEIHLVDTAGDQDHYSLTITSAMFQGKSRVQQHKMVYEALQGSLYSALHALQLKTIPA